MTMDIAHNQQRLTDLKIIEPNQNEKHIKHDYSPTRTQLEKPSLKRSFDVAFLMMPDNRTIQRQQKQQIEKQLKLDDESVIIEKNFVTDLSPRHVFIEDTNSQSPKLISNQNHHHHHNHNQQELLRSRYSQIPQNVISTTKSPPRIYDDPAIILSDTSSDNPKSAFTKVSQGNRQESPIPSPLSPDQLSCPSMSPPICTTPPRTNGLYANFRPEYQLNGAFQSIAPPVQALAAHNTRIRHQIMYRSIVGGNGSSPELISNLPNYIPASAFPFAGAPHPFVPQPDITGIVRNPAAAAILSTLIQPTLASTFTLTAQNVCAKCNISFRMTSDLVYHMRSHHKSEVLSDPNRRKREDKLKCPVCSESFRERHHLTRHMTAHQDKEGDHVDVEEIAQRKK